MFKPIPHAYSWLPQACRAGRGWLGWDAKVLAGKVGISLRQMQRIEAGDPTTEQRRNAIVAVFAAAGIKVGQSGIRVAQAAPHSE